ncbi:MAG: metallophosphoesterase [Desulfovibrio sp.]|nr:metallophosphoesterase [Desulfovibrio sp.]
MFIHLMAGIAFIYLGIRLLLPLRVGKKTKFALALLLLIISQQHIVSRFIFGGLASPEIPATVLLVQGWCFFFLLLLLVFTLVRDLVLLVRWGARKIFASSTPAHASPAFSSGRRQALMVVLASGTALWGVREAVNVPRVRDIEMVVPRLPKALDGLSIVQISDMHASPLLQGSWVSALVDRVNGLKPDLVLFTGDMVDGNPTVRAADVAPLRRLKANYGILGAAGNHEYYSNFSGWMKAFSALGITMLQNRHEVLNIQGQPLVIAGVTDVVAERFGLPGPGIATAVQGAPEGAVRILMEHRPVNAAINASQGIDLQLSGHTHGGQILGMNAVVAQFNGGYLYGQYKVDALNMYVSSGAGLWNGFPVRLGVPSEIPRIILRSA